MKRTSHNATAAPSGKVSNADPREVMRLRETVRREVVEPMRKRAAEQKDALAKARARYVR
jgi:hypothetical protein